MSASVRMRAISSRHSSIFLPVAAPELAPALGPAASPALLRWLGVPLVLVVALFASGLHRLLPWVPLPILTLAIAVGVGRVVARVPELKDLRTLYPAFLAAGLMLLGAQFEERILPLIGWQGVTLQFLHFGIMFGLFFGLYRLFGVSKRATGIVGAGLCGCAILASSDPKALAKGGDADVSLGLVLTLVCGTIGLLLFPPVAALLNLNDVEFARWLGIAMPTTAESMLAAGDRSSTTLQLTGAYRFQQNVTQYLPLFLFLKFFAPKMKTPGTVKGMVLARNLRRIPVYIWGLAALAALSFAGMFTAETRVALGTATGWCFVISLAGVGLRTNPKQLIRVLSPVGGAAVASWLVAAAILLGLIVLMR